MAASGMSATGIFPSASVKHPFGSPTYVDYIMTGTPTLPSRKYYTCGNICYK